ncbi:MAG: UDP-2,3-diacylglucosamine diphosphatase LpxI [Nitrospirae bacterium]|nr:UDP-2,3-diacylglucosamine diphosphatase LpxI [Nitrospirota bacterium]
MPVTAAQPPNLDSRIIGLIAGAGQLPASIASEAKKMGYRVVVFALKPLADESLAPFADEFCEVNVGQLGKLIKLLKQFEVRDVVMAGKVPKGLLYKSKTSIIPDARALKLLFSLKDRSDDSIMLGIIHELEKEGIKFLKTTAFTKNLLTPDGELTKKRPSKTEWKDIAFGWSIAREIGRLDIGQTIVIKDKAVMSVEAIEGTDEAILRGSTLAGPGAVIIKVSKPQQDFRFDVPVVGIDTLHIMKKVHAAILALEAHKSIIVDMESFIKEADKAGIAVVGVSEEEL